MIKLSGVVVRINCLKQTLHMTVISVQTDGTKGDPGPRKRTVKRGRRSRKYSPPAAPLGELTQPVGDVCGSMSAQQTVSKGDSCWGIFRSDGMVERARLRGCETAVWELNAAAIRRVHESSIESAAEIHHLCHHREDTSYQTSRVFYPALSP